MGYVHLTPDDLLKKINTGEYKSITAARRAIGKLKTNDAMRDKLYIAASKKFGVPLHNPGSGSNLSIDPYIALAFTLIEMQSKEPELRTRLLKILGEALRCNISLRKLDRLVRTPAPKMVNRTPVQANLRRIRHGKK